MTSLKDFFGKPGLMFGTRRAVFVDKGGESSKDGAGEKKEGAGKEQAKEGTAEYFMNIDNRTTLYKKVWTKVGELEKKGDDTSLKQAARLRRMMKTAAENEKDPVDPAAHAERIYTALNIIEHPETAKPMTDQEAEVAMAWLDKQLGIPHVPLKPGSALAKKPDAKPAVEQKPEEKKVEPVVAKPEGKKTEPVVAKPPEKKPEPVVVKKPEEKKKEEKKPDEKPAVAKKPEEKPAKVAKVDDAGKKGKEKPKKKDPLVAELDALDASMKKGLEGKPSTAGVLKGSSVDFSGLDAASKPKDKPDGGLKLGGSAGGPIKPGQGGILASVDGSKAKPEEKKTDSGLSFGPGPKGPKVEDKPKEEVKLGTRMPDTIKKDYEDFQKDKTQTQRIVVRDNVQYRFVRVTSTFGGSEGAKMTRIEVYKKELA